MREIILDTETTGLDPKKGDRVIEICALEMVDGRLTGERFHHIIDPERDIPAEASAIHGLFNKHVAGQKRFAEIADDLLAFIGDCRFIAHNASFDVGFLNAELIACDRPPFTAAQVLDTLALAKRQFPGARLSLDALSQRFNIDLSVRKKHSALVDTQLLAEVYIELTGGKQRALGLTTEPVKPDVETTLVNQATRQHHPARLHQASADELVAHGNFIGKIKNALWLQG